MRAYPFLFTYLFSSAAWAECSTCQADIRDQHARFEFQFLQLKTRFSELWSNFTDNVVEDDSPNLFFFLPAAEKMILKNEAVQETSALAQSLQVNSIHVVAI